LRLNVSCRRLIFQAVKVDVCKGEIEKQRDREI
jgi:hypothetical protein